MPNLEGMLGPLRGFALAGALALGAAYAAGCEEEESYCCQEMGDQCPYNNVCVDDADNGQSTKSLVATRPDGTKEYCDCVYSPPSDDNRLLDAEGLYLDKETAAEHAFQTAEMRSL